MPKDSERYLTQADLEFGGSFALDLENLTNAQAYYIRETAGPTKLTVGNITDGDFVKRSGTTFVSGTVDISDNTNLAAGAPITLTGDSVGLSYSATDFKVVGGELQLLAGGGAVTAEYVTLALDASLTAERVLTGTANQIVITDNGANSTVVLSLPQDIDTAADLELGTLTITGVINAGVDTDKFLVLDSGDVVDFRTGAEVLSDIGASPTSHLHDGDTLQNDGVNSDGGAFSFSTTGDVSFNQNLIIPNSGNIGPVGQSDLLELASNSAIVNGTSYLHIIGKVISNTVDHRAMFMGYRARVGPAAVESGDYLVSFIGRGYDGNDYETAQMVEMKTTQDWTPTAHGASMAFYTTPDDSVTSTERITICCDGNTGFGNQTPVSKLEIYDATFSGQYGSFADERASLLVSGKNPYHSVQISSTYNSATYPNYGLVLVNGPNTTDYDIWGIMHDGPARAAGGLCFAYLNGTGSGDNIHTTTPMVTFKKTGDVAMTGALGVTGNITGPNVTSGADPGHTHSAYVGTHAMLDGSVHTDSVADAVTRGSLIYGNSTPKWDELVISTGFLNGDGTDVAWLSYANTLAALSGQAGAAFAWNSQNLTNVGTIGCGTITVVDGSSISLQEDITFTGATTENLVKFPDNLAVALRMSEGANPYIDFITTDGAEEIRSYKTFTAAGFAKTGWPISPGVTLSFDNATKVFTVTDGGSAYYYIGGVRYTLGGNKTVDLDDVAGGAVEGLWYIYFVGSTLTASQTVWNFTAEDKALAGYVYWDATNNEQITLGYELHNFVMDGATHGRYHFGGGSAWDTGLLVSDAGSEDVNVETGIILDEDITIAITDGAGAGLWEQVLSPAQLPIYYRDGASAWRVYHTGDKANATDVGYVDVGNDLKYNKLNGTWANATVGLNNYVAYFVIATNDQTHPVSLIMGQRFDNKLTDAKVNNIFSGLSLSGLPFEEMVILARLILKDTNAGLFYTLEDVVDLRAFNAEGNVTSPLITSHSGLGDLDYASAGHVGFVSDALFDAQTVLAATVDDTPAALTVNEQTLVGRLTGGNVAAISIGITDNFIVQIDDAGAADDEYCRFTANGIEGRTAANAKTDLGFFTLDTDVDHDQTTNYVANKHIDHTGVTLTAGTGLDGGGDISANRTFNVDVDGLDEIGAAIADADTFIIDDGDSGTTKKCLMSRVKTYVGAAGAHTILDGTVHTDTVAQDVTRGSLIYGNSTPAWDELVIGTGFLGGDGTDASWVTYANTLAALSGQAVAAFSWNSQNLTSVGTIGCGTITVVDGSSINLQEDIAFTGATTENLVKFPDNLAVALRFTEAGNSYVDFISTNNSEAIRLRGKVLVGANAANDTWTAYDVIELGANGFLASHTATGAGLTINMGYNAYFDVTNTRWEYKNSASDEASLYHQVNGAHVWFSAPAGTSDNAIPWTTIMTANITDVVLSDGIGLDVYEDVTWLGATGENLALFPDNLADALSFKNVNGDVFQKFISTTGALAVEFPQPIISSAAAPAPPMANALYKDNIVKGWVQWDGNGAGVTVNDSFNVASVADTAVGRYVVTWDTDFANDDYAVAAGPGGSIGTLAFFTYAVGSVAAANYNPATGLYIDSTTLSCIAMGGQ